MRQSGPVDQIEAAAWQGSRLAEPRRTNAHIHLPPNFSAFRSVSEAVDRAAAEGVVLLGASNYYDFRVYEDFAAHARCRGVFPLYGLEIIALIEEFAGHGWKINDPGNPGKMYICGKGISRFSSMTAEAGRIMGVIRNNDSRRMARMIDRLDRLFGQGGVATDLSREKVIDRVMGRCNCPADVVYLQERHVAQAFQEVLFDRVPPGERAHRLPDILGKPPKAVDDPVSVQNDIRSHLMKAGKPGFVEESFIGFEDSYRLILELGGIPCYPVIADGISPISEFEGPVDALIANLRRRGIHAAEFIPLRNRAPVLVEYVTAMRKAGLAVTAGTEHNTLDCPPLDPACLGGEPIPEFIRPIFWEGACVSAAHQYLACHGQCGFVDAQGRPNAAYATDEERITAFARLGAAVIERYIGSAWNRA